MKIIRDEYLATLKLVGGKTRRPNRTTNYSKENKAMHKVLLVEDNEDIQAMWKDILTKRQVETQLISAFTLEEAEAVFFAETGFAAIVMDACVPGNQPNTPPLVRKMRSVFAGPIIAVSNNYDCQRMLMAAGCDHRCDKIDLPDTLIRVLGF